VRVIDFPDGVTQLGRRVTGRELADERTPDSAPRRGEPVGSSAAAPAIALTREERRVLDRLRHADATSPGAARPVEELRPLEPSQIERLLDAGVIREAAPGSYFLDQVVYASYLRRRQLTLLTVAVVAAAALAVLAGWLALRGRFG
jgi:hypothetical protein